MRHLIWTGKMLTEDIVQLKEHVILKTYSRMILNYVEYKLDKNEILIIFFKQN